MFRAGHEFPLFGQDLPGGHRLGHHLASSLAPALKRQRRHDQRQREADVRGDEPAVRELVAAFACGTYSDKPRSNRSYRGHHSGCLAHEHVDAELFDVSRLVQLDRCVVEHAYSHEQERYEKDVQKYQEIAHIVPVCVVLVAINDRKHTGFA